MAMPQFYRRVVGVDPVTYANVRLDKGRDYRFAAGASFVPLALGELEVAALHYPILFTTGTNPTPVALLGLRARQNLFVLPDGNWRAASYIPAYCRAYPFIFVQAAEGEKTYIGVEADAACLRRDVGEPMFIDGKPTPALEQAIAFCEEYRSHANAAVEFGQALAEQGLLSEEDAVVNLTAGGSLQVRGFQLVQPQRLQNVADNIFLDWRHRGWLPSLYAHLASLGCWNRLIDLATEHP